MLRGFPVLAARVAAGGTLADTPTLPDGRSGASEWAEVAVFCQAPVAPGLAAPCASLLARLPAAAFAARGLRPPHG